MGLTPDWDCLALINTQLEAITKEFFDVPSKVTSKLTTGNMYAVHSQCTTLAASLGYWKIAFSLLS